MEIPVLVGPSGASRVPGKYYTTFRGSLLGTFQYVDLDPRGLISEMPWYFALLQLVPGIGIVTGAITLRSVYKNKKAIHRETGLREIPDRPILRDLRIAGLFGLLSMLGLSLLAVLIIAAVILVIALSLLMQHSYSLLVNFVKSQLVLDSSSRPLQSDLKKNSVPCRKS
ncbi:hypothetical protein [Chlamydiifrater phoenicopteri]|uniref:hypothetical protein n=1 Tax=Chlamydiifrater phoenicopteri TaxID=2681469 RepID=UPI001BCC7500|nr:hypothetical protein [Chlamydiifrater phoenicopteri]